MHLDYDWDVVPLAAPLFLLCLTLLCVCKHAVSFPSLILILKGSVNSEDIGWCLFDVKTFWNTSLDNCTFGIYWVSLHSDKISVVSKQTSVYPSQWHLHQYECYLQHLRCGLTWWSEDHSGAEGSRHGQDEVLGLSELWCRRAGRTIAVLLGVTGWWLPFTELLPGWNSPWDLFLTIIASETNVIFHLKLWEPKEKLRHLLGLEAKWTAGIRTPEPCHSGQQPLPRDGC